MRKSWSIWYVNKFTRDRISFMGSQEFGDGTPGLVTAKSWWFWIFAIGWSRKFSTLRILVILLLSLGCLFPQSQIPTCSATTYDGNSPGAVVVGMTDGTLAETMTEQCVPVEPSGLTVTAQ
jgi:hypothetical protein